MHALPGFVILSIQLIVSVNMASGVIALANLAAVYMKERNHLKASELYKESLQIYEQSSPPLLTNIAYSKFIGDVLAFVSVVTF